MVAAGHLREPGRVRASAMAELRWGILGCGDVCEVKSGPAFQLAPGSRLVAVMRRDAAKAAGVYDNTWSVFLSDHGEMNMEQ